MRKETGKYFNKKDSEGSKLNDLPTKFHYTSKKSKR
jgi:hypothetical protein